MEEAMITISCTEYRSLIEAQIRLNLVVEQIMEDNYPDSDILKVLNLKGVWEELHKKKEEEA